MTTMTITQEIKSTWGALSSREHSVLVDMKGHVKDREPGWAEDRAPGLPRVRPRTQSG